MDSENTLPAHAVFEAPFDEETPVVFCPMCGKQVITQNEEGVQNIDPCPHLMFATVDAVPEEWYASADYRKRREENPELDPSEEEDAIAFLSKLGYDESMLVIELVGRGMACGPVCISVSLGFDLAAKPE
jgi:hypothetical protein